MNFVAPYRDIHIARNPTFLFACTHFIAEPSFPFPCTEKILNNFYSHFTNVHSRIL